MGKVKLTIFSILFVFLSFTTSSVLFAAEIFSIQPPEIYSGTEITIKGSNFSKDTNIILGDRTFKPFYVTENTVKFNTPSDITPGIYRLILRYNEGSTLPLSITVKKREPVITNFKPEVLERCGFNEEVNVIGKNLKEINKININGRNLLFLKTDSIISFKIPEEVFDKAGNTLNVYLYDENDKIIHLFNIAVNYKPYIEDVEILSRDVNFYILKIIGKNFSNESNLFVNDLVITEQQQELSNQNIVFLQRGKRQNETSQTPMLDRLKFISCNEILYYRYPYTPDDKRLLIYVENQTGEKSNTFITFAP